MDTQANIMAISKSKQGANTRTSQYYIAGICKGEMEKQEVQQKMIYTMPRKYYDKYIFLSSRKRDSCNL